MDASQEVDASHEVSPGHASGAHAPGWLPFTSMQFWTFALAFFGLTGTGLTLLGLASFVPTLAASLGMGLGSGALVSYLLHRLRRDTVTSAVSAEDYVGRAGVVRLPISVGSPGKVRLELKEQIIDLLASTDESTPIDVGEEVLVIQAAEGGVHVVRAVRVDASSAEPVGEESTREAQGTKTSTES